MYNRFLNKNLTRSLVFITVLVLIVSLTSCKKNKESDIVDSTQSVTLLSPEFEGGSKTVTVKNGEYYSFPIPKKEHYELLCWCAGDREISNSGIWNISSDITLTPKWNPKLYGLSYQLNGGYQHKNMIGYTVESDTFTIITPKRTGYMFLGWTGTGVNGIQRIVEIEKGSFGNRRYVANWQKVVDEGIQYKIVGDEAIVIGFYSSNEAIGEERISSTYKYNGKEYPVTAIENWAFADMGEFVTTLYIPESIKNIGENAFYNTNINIEIE